MAAEGRFSTKEVEHNEHETVIAVIDQQSSICTWMIVCCFGTGTHSREETRSIGFGRQHIVNGLAASYKHRDL